jgi:hypothetical protein
MLSRSEASLVLEAEILRSASGSAQNDMPSGSNYSFMNPKFDFIHLVDKT